MRISDWSSDVCSSDLLAEGDLTRRVTGDYAGVFARLKEDVNSASTTLAEAMQRIAESANTVRAAAGEISTGSQDLASRTESQAATLEQTAASMPEEIGNASWRERGWRDMENRG